MARSNVARLVVDTLAAAGVRRIYGLVGDSLNGITECLRKQDRIEWIGVRHEEEDRASRSTCTPSSAAAATRSSIWPRRTCGAETRRAQEM
jgi:hypothetical protein